MDPLSIIGLVMSTGQCIQPFVAAIRTIANYRHVERNVSTALKKAVLFCEKLELSLSDLKLIDESSITTGHKEFLRRTLTELHAAVVTHRVEVDTWILRLGLSEKLEIDGVSYTPQSIVPLTDGLAPKDEAGSEDSSSETVTRGRRCFFLPRFRFRSLSFKKKTDRITEKALIEVDAQMESKKGGSISTQPRNKISEILNKAQYVIIGELSINRMTADLEFWNSLLSSGVISAIGSIVFKLSGPAYGSSNIGLRIAHPIARFIVQAKKRDAGNEDVQFLSKEAWKTYYDGQHYLRYVDDNTASSSKQYQIYCGHAIPRSAGEQKDTGIDRLPEFRNCIFIDRGKWNETTIDDTLRLGRLFAGETESVSQASDKLFRAREDGDILRCIAVARMYDQAVLVFQLPPGSASEPKTLRSILLDAQGTSRGYPLHPLVDRAKLAVRLATSVLVIHSLGLVHKRINPETILMVESAIASSSQRFPRRLGYPYLIAFHTTRRDLDPTDCIAHAQDAERRAIYYHPRDQEARRKDRYRMQDDIFSLGVCLFEIALWRSLFIWDENERDYVHDDTFVELSESCGKWDGMPLAKMAEARTNELIRVAEELIPGTMGPMYTNAVIACLKAGADDSPFAGHPLLDNEVGLSLEPDDSDTRGDNESSKPVSISYLELVLQNLRAVHKGLTDAAR